MGDDVEMVLRVLKICHETAEGVLTPSYADACKRLYESTGRAELLVPVVTVLERDDVIDYLPAIIRLPQEHVQNALKQLVTVPANLAVSDLIYELHALHKPNEAIVQLNVVMQALNVAFGMREQFDGLSVYGIAIQQMSEMMPLPTLFLRTVNQVVKDLPKLIDFIVAEVFPRLLTHHHVYADGQAWKGFMLALQRTFPVCPNSCSVVLMLPQDKLEDVLVRQPEWKAALSNYAAKQASLPAHVRAMLC